MEQSFAMETVNDCLLVSFWLCVESDGCTYPCWYSRLFSFNVSARWTA